MTYVPVSHKNPPPPGIICKPVTDTNTGGFGSAPNQFVDLLQSPTYVKREIPDILEGGNCYWRRPDGLVLSWQGSDGLNASPQPLVGQSSFQYQNMKSLAAIVRQVSLSSGADSISVQTVIFAKFAKSLYAHGKEIASFAAPVLGSAMIQDNIILVIAISNNQHKFYHNKLSTLAPDTWVVIGEINFTNTSSREYIEDDTSYFFDSTGLNAISMKAFVDLDIILQYFPDNPERDAFISREVVRVSFSIDGNGTITMSHTTEIYHNVLFSEIDCVSDNQTTTIPPFTDIGSRTKTIQNNQGSHLYAVGFNSSDGEVLVTSTGFSATGVDHNTWSLSRGDSGFGETTYTRTQDYHCSVSVGGVSLFTNVETEVSSRNLNIPSFGAMEGSGNSSFARTTHTLLYLDTKNDLAFFTETQFTHDRTEDLPGEVAPNQINRVIINTTDNRSLSIKIKNNNGLSLELFSGVDNSAGSSTVNNDLGGPLDCRISFGFGNVPTSVRPIKVVINEGNIYPNTMVTSVLAQEGNDYIAQFTYDFFTGQVDGDPQQNTKFITSAPESFSDLFGISGSSESCNGVLDLSGFIINPILFRI